MTVRKPIMSRINATEARQNFGKVIKRAYSEGEHLIVEKNDLPVVVILSFREYEEMRQRAALQNLKELGTALHKKIQEQKLTPEQLDKKIEEAKRKVYKERYG